MSRKKNTKARVGVPAGGDTAAAPAQAQAALAAGQYKVAIELFKELLKRERRAEGLAGLAAAYAGRAEQLAAKGMVKEALALWRTRSQACGVPLLGGNYVGWLLKDGQVEAALGLRSAIDALPPEAQPRAQAELAAAVLLAGDAALSGWPADHPLIAHRAAARAALAACLTGDAPDAPPLEAALGGISHRSPFRDLRPLLKALALHPADPPLALAALARVPANGPFEPLAAALRVCLMPGTQWLAGLSPLDDAGRALVLDLKGCPPSQRLLVLDAMRLAAGAAPAAPDLFDLVLRQRRALGDPLARPTALRLLVHAPQRQRAFDAAFLPLSPPEEERLLALAAELKRQPDAAQHHWLQWVELLGATVAGKLPAALVLRRLVDQERHHRPDEVLDRHSLAWLSRSLALDPTDLACHLRLLRNARLGGDLKQARTRLDAARCHFPDDSALLYEAVEIALAGGAFKKAAALARQMLQADPLNPRVRGLIGQAHLAHARKQIAARKPEAAQRELEEAANWLRGGADLGLHQLLRGLCAPTPEAADALLRGAVAELGPPLVGAWQLALEAARAGQPVAVLLRRAGVDAAATSGPAETAALARVLNTLPTGDGAVRAAFIHLRATLHTASAAVGGSESEFELICEALLRHEQRDLTRRFAAAARKRWPQRPLFDYLEAAGRYGAQPWRIPDAEWRRLDRAFERARAQGDPRTAARISKLLGGGGGGGGGRFDADLPDLPDLRPQNRAAGDPRGLLEVMLSVLGEDAFLDMARQQLGKSVFDALRSADRGGNKAFARAMLELMVLADTPGPAPLPRILPRILPPKLPKPPKASRPSRHQPDLFDD